MAHVPPSEAVPEDLGACIYIEANNFTRLHPKTEAYRDNAARRRTSDEVEMIDDIDAVLLLQLRQYCCGEQTAYSTAVE